MSNSLASLVQNKPYTFRPLKEQWILNWFRRIEYGIYFEDTLIRTTTLDYENLKEYVSLMNCAWQMGAGSGWAVGSLDAKFAAKDQIKALEARIEVLAARPGWDE